MSQSKNISDKTMQDKVCLVTGANAGLAEQRRWR